MAELTETTQQQESPKVMTMGKVERLNVVIPKDEVINNSGDEESTGKSDIIESAAPKMGDIDAALIDNTKKVEDKAKDIPALTEDQLKAYFESQGIKYEGLEKLKEKVNYEPSTEPTVEEKEAAIKAKEKRAIDKFVAGGGTVEQYVAIKEIVKADPTQFAINTAKNELIKSGYTAEEAENFLKEQYFQIDDEELEQDEDETDKAFKKRTKEFFAKQLANISSPYKKQAVDILAELNSVIDSEDLQAQQEVAISAKIDEDFKALPRKLQIEIGEINGKAVSPVDYDVSETDLAEIRDMLKDTVKRNNFLYNTDGSLNTTNLTSILTKAKMFDSVAKVSYLTGMDSQVKVFQKTFGAGNAYEIGVGGSAVKQNGIQNGKPSSFGKTQRTQPQRN